MKKIYTLLTACAFGLALTNCDDFLDYQPTAVIDEETAFSAPEEMVNAAYAWLGDDWFDHPFNLWPYGDVASDDCLKGGSGLTDNWGYHTVEIWTDLTETAENIDGLWYTLYCGISRCNRALVALEQNGNAVLGEEVTKQRIAEVKFLRGHWYYKLIV